MKDWSRRRVLKTVAVSSGAAALAAKCSLAGQPAAADKPRTLKKTRLRIALMQAETAPDVQDNYRRAFQMAREAGRQKPDLMVFPELFAIGYRPEGVSPYAQPITGEARREFEKIARETGSHIIFGLPLKLKDGIYNSVLLLSPSGLVGVCHKTHLVYNPDQIDNEQKLFLPGQKLGNFDTALGSLGVYICHDGLFPEVPRCLTLNGADLLVYCVNNGAPGNYAREHAYYNKIPVAAVNPVHSIYDKTGKRTGGGSALVAADKSVVCESQEVKEEFLIGEVDLALGRQLRAEGLGGNDIFRVRRPELYGAITRPKSTPGTLFGIKNPQKS